MGVHRRHPPVGRVLKRGGGRSPRRGSAQRGSRPPPRPARPPGPYPIVAVFTKAPVPGQVKTRLTPILRAREAAELAKALLLDTLDVVARARLEAIVAFTPAAGRRALERLLGRGRRLVPQGSGDLGARLARVLGQLADARSRPVLAIGTDCPALTHERLDEARRALTRREVVVGPALDGGFYLLGLRRPRPELFAGVPWSTSATLAAIEDRARQAELSIERLEPERDLDTPEDLYEWFAGAREAGLDRTYPRTWTVLHAILPPRRLAALEAAVRGEPPG